MLHTLYGLSLAICVSTGYAVDITFAPKYRDGEFPGLNRCYSPSEGVIGSLTEIEPHARNNDYKIFNYLVYLETLNPFYNKKLSLNKVSICRNEERKRTYVYATPSVGGLMIQFKQKTRHLILFDIELYTW